MSAQAALLSLRSFNLFSGWPEVASMTKDEFDDYLAARGLFWKNRPCPNCNPDGSHRPLRSLVTNSRSIVERWFVRIVQKRIKSSMMMDLI
ncbi:hypothetical protein L3Y34_001897 [Caenorhabditis briggsae]|uniref:Uncharacterized protein n=1 Tax=Caenorhabditis briggsae TaxID=6238 RepID=A0AAE9DE19_CAEBR|nr:hypothetical protein L3Y34_001897 [Caenorhabditis briggsae]